MILDRPLTAKERAKSQRNMYSFNAVNGLSYMCLGETVIILLAVKTGSPDAVVAILGAMIYFGFLLLPLGKTVTARIGAARSQASFWVARNIAALLVASAPVWYVLGAPGASVSAMILGAFLFYGFRAAGVVMSQPLVGDISTEDERARVIATNGGLFYAFCFIALAVICWIMRISDSIWTLSCIIVVGAVLGVLSSRFISRIDETSAIMESARKPLRAAMAEALETPALRRLLLCGFAINLAVIMVMPISVLVVKNGYGMSDSQTLVFTLMQFATSAAMSFAVGKATEKIGPRKAMIVAFIVLLCLMTLWVIAPFSGAWVTTCCTVVFLLMGTCRVSLDNAMTHYFLQTVKPGVRVAASILLNTITGVFAGVAGMALSGGLLSFLQRDSGNSDVAIFNTYRTYFLVAFALLAPGIAFILRLEPLPMEKRRIKRTWWNF